ncbi:hypothetical protein BJV82DRAFT_625104 [Fennellomyces sp. T-0311]|nr:hypothetical protein BJV82DRAFT_625104 [Fennellomyces sp. T-0311]
MLQSEVGDYPPCTAACLPQDILLNIDNYIWPEDRYACLFVCRQWYFSFVSKFYNSVALQSGRQCTQLCNGFDAIEQSHTFPGHAVKQLHMDLSTEELEKTTHPIPGYFPSLQSFHVSSFRIQNSGNSHHHHDVIGTATCGKIAPSRSMIGSTIDTFWTLPPSLTRLHLSIPRLQREATMRLLRHLPQLTSLYLNWINGSWMCSDMDMLHELCPSLDRVWIFAETFHTNSQAPEQREPAGVVDEEQEMTWDDNIINQLFPPYNVAPAAPKLTQFHLSIYRGLTEHMSDWFVYAARNYPDLESFSLETRPKHLDRVGERAFEYDLLDMLMTYKWASPTWKRAEVPAFRLLVASCPQLRSVNLFQLYLTNQLLMALFSCPLPMQHFGSTRNIHRVWTADNNWYFSSSLVSLSLQACVTSPANNGTFMAFLGSLIHLKHLCLARYDHFAMDSLLAACPGLETLTLEHMAITDPLMGIIHTHYDEPLSLHLLTIRQTILREPFFSQIPPSLVDLVVENSAIIGTETYRAKLQMPQLELDTLTLNHLFFEQQDSERKTVKQSGQQFSVIGIECMEKASKWYDIRGGVFSQSNERVLGVRPMASEDAEDMLEDDKNERIFGLEVSCRTIKRIRVNSIRLLDVQHVCV